MLHGFPLSESIDTCTPFAGILHVATPFTFGVSAPAEVHALRIASDRRRVNRPERLRDRVVVDDHGLGSNDSRVLLLIDGEGIQLVGVKVSVSLHLTHTYDPSLAISLIGPDGTAANLSAHNGYSYYSAERANYGRACTPLTSRTTFDDAAATAITSATAPLSARSSRSRPCRSSTARRAPLPTARGA